ncbi:hypothetical protein BDQ12DRAFT_590462, partial [Crucibulum laeve]
CRRQFAKYTCPTCNVPYCSLTCFRSEAHSQCSETFYKKEVESDIRSEPSKTAEERLKMIELLKKFEEESGKDNGLGDLDEDEEGNDLAKRFDAVNLDELSPDALWEMLTPEERKKFMKALDDPNSELAQQLLSSEQLEKEIQEPWWEASGVIDNDEEVGDSIKSSHHTPRRCGKKPEMICVPASMVKPIPHGPPLVFNACAICIAYAYTTRNLGASPLSSLKPESADYHEARKTISRLVPFVSDRKSTTLYPDFSSVMTDIWSRFDLGTMTSDLFALLLRDAVELIKPRRVTQVESSSPNTSDIDPSSHPHNMLLFVFSDLSRLFETLPSNSSANEKLKPNHVTYKLLFYAAHILSTPTPILQMLDEELSARARGFEQE